MATDRARKGGGPSRGTGGHFRLVTLATSTSRVAGFVRDQLNAHLFGTGVISDAYFMAIRIPSLLRDLFAEGALSNAFVPTLAKRLAGRDRRDAWEMMSQVFTLLLLVTGGLSVLGILFASQVVTAVAPGFLAQPGKFYLTVELTRVLFPTLLFVSMAALWMGALNSLHRFGAPAFAPVFMNLAQILVGVALITVWKGEGAEAELRNIRLWTWAMALGMLLQWVTQLPAGRKAGIRVGWSWPPRHPGVGEVLRLMGPSVASSSVMQVNLLINQFFASFLATGYVSYLYYGNRLMQLPFGVLGVSIATVTFPLLSRYAAEGAMGSLSRELNRAFLTSLFLMMPATVGIWIVAEPACRLAFEYGKFTQEATRAAAQATALYALGLVAYTGTKVLLPAFYACGNRSIPLRASLASVAANLGLNTAVFLWVVDPRHKFWGLALASSFGALVNMGWLLSGLRGVKVRFPFAKTLGESAKVLVASAVMGVATWGTLHGVRALALPWGRFFEFALPVSAGAALYIALSMKMRLEGVLWVTQGILGKFRRGR